MAQVKTDLGAISGTPVVEISATSGGAIIVNSATAALGAVIIGSTISEEYNTWKLITVVIKAASAQWYQNVISPILSGSDTPVLWVRFGIKTGSIDTYMRPWEQMILLRPTRQPDQNASDGGLIKLEFVDSLFLLNRAPKTVARKGTLMAIANKIMSENAITASVIEDANTTTSTLWIQSNETDYDFLCNRLAHYFVGKSGSGDYRIYCRDNTIHFHTITADNSGSYTYSADFTKLGNLSRLKFGDEFYPLMLDGGAGVEAVVVDPIAGTSTGVSESATSSTGGRPVFSDAVTLLLMHAGPNQLVDTAGRAQDRYDSRRNNYFTVQFVVKNNPLVQIGDIVNVGLSSKAGADASAGEYLVTAIEHELGKHATSIVTAKRGQMAVVASSTSTLYTPGQAITPLPSTAPISTTPSGNTPVFDTDFAGPYSQV